MESERTETVIDDIITLSYVRSIHAVEVGIEMTNQRACIRLAAAAFALWIPGADAMTLSAVFSDGTVNGTAVTFTDDAKAQIRSALDFYNANFNGSAVTQSIAFTISDQGGGAQSSFQTEQVGYSDFRNALLRTQSGSAVDQAVMLPGAAPAGYAMLSVTEVLAGALGLDNSVTASAQASCGGAVAIACIQLDPRLIRVAGTNAPAPDLFGTVQHEVDEVLGTASSLKGVADPATLKPAAADLFRYSGGQLTFQTNAATTDTCDGAATASFSFNGGASTLADYNNCNNGGDYGDFKINTLKVQDFKSSSANPTALSLVSPEVQLLDAVGYNLTPGSGPGPSTGASLVKDPVLTQQIYGGPDDGGVPEAEILLLEGEAVPEPASAGLLTLSLIGAAAMRRRRLLRPTAG